MVLKNLIHGFSFKHDAVGENCSWVAIDNDGLLGYFDIDYDGPLPTYYSDNLALLDDVYEDIVYGLPVTSGYLVAPNMEPNYGDVLISERGIYCFGWNTDLAAFQLKVVPETPLHISSLDDRYRKMFARVHLDYSFKGGKANELLK